MKMKMNPWRYSRLLLLLAVSLFKVSSIQADTFNVAVASNFAYTLKLLSADFKKRTSHQLRISSASTGKLYTQIKHGAPFDVFLSADEKHPKLLVSENMAESSSAYVYAKGQIVLMSNIAATGVCQDILTSPALNRLSIANPKTAPYGAAAKQVLEKLSLWKQLQPRLVKGENIAQTLQFVTTKNAQAGFVAKSMLNMGAEIESACIWDIPTELYSPIKQSMVLLTKAKDKVAAQEFIEYIKTPHAKEIIKATGYDIL